MNQNTKLLKVDSTRDEVIRNLTKSNTLLQEKMESANNDLQRKTVAMEKLEKSMKAQSDEVLKANDIIKKLQSDIKTYHGKAKLRGQLATEQEKVLTSKDSEIEKLSNENSELLRNMNALKDELRTTSERCELANTKLNEAEESLKMNEEIINWLNKKLSGTQIGQLQQCIGGNSMNSMKSQPPMLTVQNNCAKTEASLPITPATNQHHSDSGMNQHTLGPPSMASTNLPTTSTSSHKTYGDPVASIPHYSNPNGQEGTSATTMMRAQSSSDTQSGRVRLSEADYIRDGYKPRHLTGNSATTDRMRMSEVLGDQHTRTTSYVPAMSNNVLKIPYRSTVEPSGSRDKLNTKSSRNVTSIDSTSKMISSYHHARFAEQDSLGSHDEINSQRYRPVGPDVSVSTVDTLPPQHPMSKAYLQDELASNSSCSAVKSGSVLQPHHQSLSSAYFPVK